VHRIAPAHGNNVLYKLKSRAAFIISVDKGSNLCPQQIMCGRAYLSPILVYKIGPGNLMQVVPARNVFYSPDQS